MLAIGEDHFPDSKRVVIRWPVEGRAETPIRIALNGQIVAALPANTMATAPEPVARLLVESGYDVEVLGDVAVDPEPIGSDNQAPTSGADDANQSITADALVRLPIPGIASAIATGLPPVVISEALALELAGQQRKGAIDLLAEAIKAVEAASTQQDS